MPRCAVWFADDQIRESATIGGNLVNGSPAADGTPALLALAATVVLAAKRDGKIIQRKLPLDEFAMGPSKTALGPDEILLEIECDDLPGYGGAFEKVGHRRSLVISTACVAALVQLDATGRFVHDVRLACAGIGPVPQRMEILEAGLRGKPLSESVLVEAAAQAPDFVASRTRQDYRREVVRGFVLRALINAARRAGAGETLIRSDFEANHV